jgi:hypothetical protein
MSTIISLESHKRAGNSDHGAAVGAAKEGLIFLAKASDKLREAAKIAQSGPPSALQQAAVFWTKLADEIDEVLERPRRSHV